MNNNYNTYYLNCSFVDDEQKINDILCDNKIKILHINITFNLELLKVKKIENILNNLPQNIEYLIILHEPYCHIPITNLYNPYKNCSIINAYNISPYVKEIYYTNNLLFKFKIPFNCSIYNIRELENLQYYTQITKKIISYN